MSTVPAAEFRAGLQLQGMRREVGVNGSILLVGEAVATVGCYYPCQATYYVTFMLDQG